jgi:hypothetical protein
MLMLWDESIVGLHFLLQGGAISNAALTENAQIVTSQDGITNFLSPSRPEYCDEITLEVPVAEADESCFITPNTYYLTNWLMWCYTGKRVIRVFQCDEDFGACRVFRCVVRAIPREVAPFANFGNAEASAKIPLSALDGPKLPLDLPDMLGWDLHVVEDGVWSPSLTTVTGIPNAAIITLTALSALMDNSLSVNYTGFFPAVNISYEQVNPGAINQPLTVSVLTNDDLSTLRKTEIKISVSLKTNGAGALVTTGAELLAALLADAEAAALILPALASGHDAKIVPAFAKAWITGWSEEDNTSNTLWDRSA